MINAYSIFSEISEIERSFAMISPIEDWNKKYYASPAELLPVIIQGNNPELKLFNWGTTKELAKGKSVSKKLTNLHIDQVQSRKVYRDLLQEKRCILPANGFFIWKQIGKKLKTPYYCQKSDSPLFGICGIWDNYENLDGSISYTFNMLVNNASDQLKSYTDLMPVCLGLDDAKEWLKPHANIDEAQKTFDTTSKMSFILHPVSPKLLDLETNSIEITQPSIPSDQFGNYTLFG